MERIIEIDGTPVPMKATASTLTRYRAQYGRDLIEDFDALQKEVNKAQISGEAIDIFIRLAHTMAKQADKDITADPWDWVDQFETFPIREILLPIVSLWSESLGMKVEAAEKKE